VLRRPVIGLSTTLVTVLAAALTSLATAPTAAAADRDCGDFRSQRDAQVFFLNAGGPHSDPHRLDSDGDGIACETNPAPYYYGTTPPGGGGGGGEQTPEPQVTVVQSTVRVAVAPTQRIAGESFRITATVRPATSRKVVLQRRVDGRWRSFASATTNGNGVTSRVFSAPRATVAYRAVAEQATKGTKKYTAATSDARTLRVQRQRVTLSFADRTVDHGRRVTAVVRATPVRAGRRVALQVRANGAWRTVRTAAFDRRGRTTVAVAPALGRSTYRAVAMRHHGAAAQPSGTAVVTASDGTAPPAPYDLVAVPGDGSVSLSWSRVAPTDFSHHEVWVRTSETDWSVVATTNEATYDVAELTNGVAHTFTVTSVDRAGNRSATATAVTATPTAPVLPPRLVG
jgi:hypothetical protein